MVDLFTPVSTTACIVKAFGLGYAPVSSAVLRLWAGECLDTSANRHCLVHDVKMCHPELLADSMCGVITPHTSSLESHFQ